jgi:hypothetical protein
MFKNFVYALSGPSPPDNSGLGWWGFSAYLDRDFAVKLRETSMNERNYNRLNKEAREIVTKYDLDKMGEIANPYGFVEGSWLLWGIQVPGNSCDLSLDCDDRESFLENNFEKEKDNIKIQKKNKSKLIALDYIPHNIDNMEQAFCMSSLFTNWANQVNLCFNH